MARSEHLPIYKQTYDLCVYFEKIVRNFSRYQKYSIGQDLRDGARRAIRLVVRANSRYDRVPVLLELREELEELKRRKGTFRFGLQFLNPLRGVYSRWSGTRRLLSLVRYRGCRCFP